MAALGRKKIRMSEKEPEYGANIETPISAFKSGQVDDSRATSISRWPMASYAPSPRPSGRGFVDENFAAYSVSLGASAWPKHGRSSDGRN